MQKVHEGRRMTIVDIAKEAGYSVSTVSRVLNGRSDVNPQTRDKIMQIVETYRFVPNNNARHLKQIVSQSILILVKGTSNMLFSSIIESVRLAVENTKYSLRVHYLNEETNEVQEAYRMCREQKPKGILFLGCYIQNFKKDFKMVTVPCVLVTDRGDELAFDNLSSVSTDDVAAAEKAVNYLFENGHRHIAVIGGETEMSSPNCLRKRGCLKSFEKYGCNFDERYYATARYSYDSAYKAMERLLAQGLPITAVFAMSDVMAVGAMRAIFDAKLRVSEDISVIGFDGTLLADYYNPKLVTIQQGAEEIARRSVEILLSMIELDKPAVHELIPFVLKNEESVKQLLPK